MRVKHPVLMFLALTLWSCTRDAPPEARNPTSAPQQAPASRSKTTSTPIAPDPKPTNGACDAIRDATFRSVESFDTGLGPDGKPAMAPLTVEFRDGVVRFQVADTSLTAPYLCTEGNISGSSASGGFQGHYDVTRGTLTWNGHEYAKTR